MKAERAAYLLLLLATLSCNCSKKSEPPAERASTTVPRNSPPAPGEIGAMVKSSNTFAFDLFAQLRERIGNLAFSPVSIATALTMAWCGAKGETAAEMKNILHLEMPESACDSAGTILTSFKNPARKTTLRAVNRLFGDKRYAIEKSYIDRAVGAFPDPLEQLDFRNSPERARVQINDWLTHQTEDHIKDLLPPGSVETDTRLVLVNAIYFLASWARPFQEDQTRRAVFQVSPGANHDVPTMNCTEQFAFAARDGVKVLEMPYAGGEAAMTFVLPDKADGLEAIERETKGSSFDKWLSALRPEQVAVSIPRFKIDPADPISLSSDLRTMGMRLAFSDRADFTGIAKPSRQDERIFLGKVLHKAFVKIDEKGTEATAGTAVQMVARGLPPVAALQFRADHPFLFFLRDVQSGMILFMGRVADPAAT